MEYQYQPTFKFLPVAFAAQELARLRQAWRKSYLLAKERGCSQVHEIADGNGFGEQ
jgi:hypothetical protein